MWMRIHPTVHPPVLQLGPVCTLSTHDECVGVVGWLSPAGGWLKRVVAVLKIAVYTGDTADYKLKVLGV